MTLRSITAMAVLLIGIAAEPLAQARMALPTASAPQVVSAGGLKVRVVLAAGGLVNPWAIAFLPGDEGILVNESPGRLRLVTNDTLVADPVWEMPPPAGRDVLHGLAIHPDFAKNRSVYVSYAKTKDKLITLAVARGRFDKGRLTDVREIFVADAWGSAGNALNGRLMFGPDRTLYVTIGDRDSRVLSDDNSERIRSQSLSDHVGKVLRLTDAGGVPKDNPFVGRADARPEIFTYGHRNPIGLTVHPDTGELWITDIGPMGGDRIDILKPGRNYGWPLVSLGRNYTGNLVSEQPWWRPDVEMPRLFWSVPVISPSSLVFYTGDRIPQWQGNLFVGTLTGQHLQRIVMRPAGRGGGGQAEQRQQMLTEFGARVRDVQQSPDGYLYLATEMAYGSGKPDGTLLRLEPAN